MRTNAYIALVLLCLSLAACQEEQQIEVIATPTQPTPTIAHRKPTAEKQTIASLIGKVETVEAIEPANVISIESDILDLVVTDNKLLISSIGFIEIYNLDNFESIERLTFDKIENFYGELHSPRLFSADISQDGNRIVFVKETATGKSVVQLQQSSTRTTLVPEELNLAIRKIRFLDEHRILMATIESEAIIYDLNDSQITSKKQLSRSSFSDFSINPSNLEVVFANESGAIPLINGGTGEIESIIEGGNLDDIYDLNYTSNVIITAGKDRSVSIYDLKSDTVAKYTAEFYFYAVALNADAQLALFVTNEENQIGLFELRSQKIKLLLNGNGKTIERLNFINNHLVLGATYNQIFIWSFK